MMDTPCDLLTVSSHIHASSFPAVWVCTAWRDTSDQSPRHRPSGEQQGGSLVTGGTLLHCSQSLCVLLSLCLHTCVYLHVLYVRYSIAFKLQWTETNSFLISPSSEYRRPLCQHQYLPLSGPSRAKPPWNLSHTWSVGTVAVLHTGL